MTGQRHFRVTAADGGVWYASLSGDQPEPAVPPGGSVVPVAEAPPVVVEEPPARLPNITRRQLILALHAAGFITAEEALAAATGGAMPAAFSSVVDGMPAADALAARITWASMQVAERHSPLWALVIAHGLATEEQIDDLFRAGARL